MTDPADPKKFTPSAPDSGFPVSRRCVEITTDEHGSILIAFVPVSPTTAFITTTNQRKENSHD